MLSRWALESNLLPFFLLLGIYFLILARERPAFMLLSAFTFALSLYAYGTSFIFLPFFLIFSLVYMIFHKELKLKYLLPSVAIFMILALPIALCNLFNILNLGEKSFSGLTLPALTQTRQASTTVFGAGGFGQAIDNLASFLKLFWTQNDGLPWNSTADFGLFYGIAGLIPAVIGLFFCICGKLKRNGVRSESYLLFALLSSFAAACLIDININRINMAFLPVIYFQALGVYLIIHAFGKRAVCVFVCSAALLCSLFAYNYFTRHQKTLSSCFFEGLGEAIRYAGGLDTEGIWITGQVNSPYIYVLFYDRVPPGDFIDSVEYIDPDAAFRAVSSFGSYRFGGKMPEGDFAYIIPADNEYAGELKIMGQFGNYFVALP